MNCKPENLIKERKKRKIMVQKIREDPKHTHFVSFMLDKASKKDPEPKPYNHEGIDEKEIEDLTKEIRDRGSVRKEKAQDSKKC